MSGGTTESLDSRAEILTKLEKTPFIEAHQTGRSHGFHNPKGVRRAQHRDHPDHSGPSTIRHQSLQKNRKAFSKGSGNAGDALAQRRKFGVRLVLRLAASTPGQHRGHSKLVHIQYGPIQQQFFLEYKR
jgi:hypothetical protein